MVLGATEWREREKKREREGWRVRERKTEGEGGEWVIILGLIALNHFFRSFPTPPVSFFS